MSKHQTISSENKMPNATACRFSNSKLNIFGLTLLALIGAALYSNTLGVPWYFDDLPIIVEQPAIRDVGYAFQNLMTPRGVANLTFALNYHYGGINTSGYHLVNILIHIITAGLVFLILKRVWKNTLLWPFFGALIFLVHPIQTQSVTYIVQRLTSLCGLFFFLSIYFFLHARSTLNAGCKLRSVFHLRLYFLALLCGALAVLTKQNAAILPGALFLFEVFFPAAPKRNRWGLVIYLLPFLIVPIWIGVSQFVLPVLGGATFQTVTSTQSLTGSGPVTPSNYLFTEFTVLWLYIKLLFLPVGQALDYSYPIVNRLFSLPNVLALLGLIGLGSLAIYLINRRPMISFGIFWFFLTLSIESTIIPLDPVFEHRLYIPMFGFIIILVDLLVTHCNQKNTIVAMSIITLAFSGLTWQRNALWNNPVAFYESNLKQSPGSERTNGSLAKAYMDNKRYDDARQVLVQGLKINPHNAKLQDNLGTLYDLTGLPLKAIETFKKAIKTNPTYYKSFLNLGVVYAGKGEWAAAIEWYKKAIALSVNYGKAHYNLGVAYYRQNRLNAALQEFKIASKLIPDNAEAQFNLSSVSLELGDIEFARKSLPNLARLNTDLARELQMEISQVLNIPK